MQIIVMILEAFPVLTDGIVAALETDPAISVSGTASGVQELLELVFARPPNVAVIGQGVPEQDRMLVLFALYSAGPVASVVMVDDDDVGPALAGASGYVSTHAPLSQLREAVTTVHAGGSFVSPDVAETMRQAPDPAGGRLGPPKGAPAVSLTPREAQVLCLVAEGRTNAEVAGALSISEHTVHTHLKHIREKTRCRRRTDLASVAARWRDGMLGKDLAPS